MGEHKICKGCKWNKYPLCEGTSRNGRFMKIDKLWTGFMCGQKDKDILTDHSIPLKSERDLKMEELEARIDDLEKK